MPDAIDVIKGLECIVSSGNAGMRDDCASCIYPGSADCLAPALRDALALLKVQEPVEPILKREGWNKYHNDYVCPICGDDLTYEQQYCAECGRKVKWG